MRSQPLWDVLTRRTEAVVNGYFIAADPLVDFYRPWPRRGLLQLFADFFAQVGE